MKESEQTAGKRSAGDNPRSPPTPQKLETGERLGEIEVPKDYQAEGVDRDTLDYYSEAGAYRKGYEDARAQQKPGESDVEAGKTDLDYKNGKPFSASDEYLYSKKIEELKANLKTISNELVITRTYRDALEKELAAEKEAHEETKHRMCYESETVQMKLIRERDAALASKAAAEGALEEIRLQSVHAQFRHSDMKVIEDMCDAALAQLKEKKE